jgi:DNA polymerase-3 subunit delta
MDDLTRQLDSGRIAPIYVVCGAEEFLKRDALAAIRRAVLGDADPALNQVRLMWRETSANAIVNECQTLPMFAERRLIIVHDIDAIKADDSAVLAAYLADPSDHSTLVLVGTKPNQRLKVFSTAKKIGRVDIFKGIYANRVPAWIQSRARAEGVRIDPDAARLLGDVVGTDLAALSEAIERLILFVSKSGADKIDSHIKLPDVETCIARTRMHTVFELTDALGRRRSDDALRILTAMLDAREPPLRILTMIVRHFRRLWDARRVLDRGGAEEEVGRSLNIHSFFLTDFVRQANLFNEDTYQNLFHQFYETDRSLKTSRVAPDIQLQHLVLQVCG